MYAPSKFLEVMTLISPVKLLWKGQYWSIGDWGKHRIEVVQTNRSKNDENV